MLKIVVVGSGWASSSFIKNLDNNKYDVTVISPNNKFLYTPLLANNIRNNTTLTMNINKLNKNNKINYIDNYLKRFNFNNNFVLTQDDIPYNYDFLVLSYGSEINTFSIPGVQKNCKFIKTTNDVDSIREDLIKLPNNSKIAVIGCGLTGTEVIGNLLDYNKFKIYAIDALPLPLSTFNNNIRSELALVWINNNINCIFNHFVEQIDDKFIYLKNNSIEYDMAIWCGGIKRHILTDIINNELELDCRFGVPVDNYMKVKNIHNVYAIGDCAYNTNPPTAQVAYQEGQYLAEYFNNNCQAPTFKYQDKGQICYIGQNSSIYQYNDSVYFSGKICGYINKLIHLYNSINLEQMFNILWNK